MPFCTRCGGQLLSEHDVCRQCGNAIQPQSAPRATWVIGRDPDCTIRLDFPVVSGQHCKVVAVSGGYAVEDLGSTNGTYLGTFGNRLCGTAVVARDAVIFLGSYRFPLSALATLAAGGLTRGFSSDRSLHMHKHRVVIGRDERADVVVEHPQVSRRHACVEVKSGNFIITDLGSANGTYINGRRIRTAVLSPGDSIGLGNHVFVFTADKGLTAKTYSGDVTVSTQGIWVAVQEHGRSKVLLEDISFTAYPGELVGIMGPSGSGKTTLLFAMLGIVKPAKGACLLNGSDIRGHYDEFRSFIGYVPQDDVIHPELKVREALEFAGRLRLPPDMTQSELDERVRRTLALVNLEDAAEVLVGSPEKKGISGGQRKRLNIALELLTEPSLILLDEPTSGLSSEDAVGLLNKLREFTNQGKTILLTIHQPGYRIYSTLDNALILCSKTRADLDDGIAGALPGRLAYYGPAVANFGAPATLQPDSITFFNPELERLPREDRVEVLKDPEAPLAGMDRKPSSHWVASYARHPLHDQYVASRTTTPPTGLGADTTRSRHKANPLRQLAVLTQRYALTKIRDRAATLGLLAQAPIIGALLSMVFDKKDPYDIPIFLLVVVAIWFGCINSVTELVKEKAIFRRERMVFLQDGPYVLSKVAVLGLLSAFQSGILLGVLKWCLHLQGPFIPMFAIMFLCSLGGLALGLLLSAIRPTLGSAMSILPIVLTVQIVLGGAMQPLPSMDVLPKSLRLPQWAAQLTLSRWGYEAILSIEEKARHRIWERSECAPVGCSFDLPSVAIPEALPDIPPVHANMAPTREDTTADCMQYPQSPVCCKFLDFQIVGTPEARDVHWKPCTEESRFEDWREVPLSSVWGNACALLAIVLLSFAAVFAALKLKN